MVKKIKYIVPIFIFFLSINVKAFTLGTPNSYAYFDDNTITGPQNATLAGYWGSNNYYRSPYLMGGVSSSSYVKRIDFNWDNSNLCPNEDISISGYVAGLTSFFNEQSYTFIGWNGGEAMSCSTTIQENGSRLYYRCYGKGGGTFHIYLFQNSYSLVKQYTIGVSREVDLSCDVSNKAIVEQSITNSQNIINNQNSNTNQIIQNNEQNTQEIIDNQNSNTEKEIESQKVCKWNLKEYNKSIINGNYLYFNNATSSTDMVFEKGKYKFEFDYSKQNNGNLYLRISSSSTNLNVGHLSPYVIEQNESFNLWFWTNQTISSSFVDTVKIYKWECINGNQGLNDSINDLNDTLNDTSQPNTNSDINEMNDMVASDTPISDLITMPLTLINAYINGINSSCSPVNLGNLYGTDLILPCIDLEQKLGSNLWRIIDSFFTIFMCYNIGMLFITAFDGITSLRDDFEGLYQPRHAETGYKPKHGG